MTNEQLIELLEQKTPDELTPDEIELLRGRLAESPELREVLIGQLQMETYLAAALSHVNISPEKVVARAQQQTQAGSGGVLLVLAILISLPLLALAGAVLMSALPNGPPGGPIAGPVAKAPPKPAPDPAQKGADKKAAAPGNPLAEAIRAAQAGKGRTVDPAGKAPPAQPPSAPPTKPAAPLPPPWQTTLDPAVEPLPLAQVAFSPFDLTKSMPQTDDLRAWLEQVPGFNFQLNRIDTRYGRCGAFEGVARLRAPWPEDAVLRLALENYNRLQMHFFHGEQGVTLVYYEDLNYRWAAYATTREPGKAQPKTWAITSTDDDRCRRTELRQGGPIEIRYAAGELVLSRGDIVLVSAPLAGPPSDVVFEGRTAFQGIALVRGRGTPALLPPSPVALDLARPADLDWRASKPEIAQPQKLPDGGLRFAADKAKERVHCYAPLAACGIHAIVLALDDVSPGSAVHFCYEQGQPQEVIRFYRDRRSGRMAVQVRGGDDEWERDIEAPHERPTALVQPKCWIKLLYGCGNVRWWLSADGVHWAQPDMAHDGLPPRPTGIGLEVVANRPDTHITLRRITVHELAGLSALAPAELRERAIAPAQAPSLGIWLAEVLAKKPADVATADWLRACAIRSLEAGLARDQAYPILEALLDDMSARDLPLEQQLAALNDATLICWDLRDNGSMRLGVPRRYLELGLQAADESGVPAFSSVRHALMSGPWMTHLVGPPELERIVRAETIQRSYAPRPAETLQYVRALRLFNQDRYSPLADWAESLAARDAPGRPSGEGLAKIKDGWRDPLIEELSKETYNTTTEIQAVLESEAWPDAARLITSVDAEAAPGVAPYIKDRMLLASLPVAVRLTLDDYPQVREALGDRFGPLARLRVGQAMAAGDAATVEMATVQFAGTDAAAQAHQWLGDRALSSGWFERAIAEYRRAIAVLPSLKSQIEPRIRLAAAMLGRDLGQPVMQNVQFNELSMTPAEFEALVAEMRGRGNAATLALAALPATRPPLPAAKRYDAQNRSRLDGPVGERPQEEVGGRRTNQFRVPWADRQIATAVEGDVLYVANRFQVAAYNLTNGQRMWQSQTPPGAMQRAQEWPLIAMRPLVTGNRIYVRLLYSPNPLLVCLEKSSGKLLWNTEAQPREFFMSDPVVVQGQLGIVSIFLQLEQQGVLRWNTLDPETGEVQSQRDLVKLRNTWGARTCCELVPLADSVVAALGGVTLAFDPAGQVRWVRKHVTVPADEDPRWTLQLYQPPLVAAGRMYVAQPGVRTVDCLDPVTGRQHWSIVLPELVGLIGLSGQSGPAEKSGPTGPVGQESAANSPLRLILRTDRDIRALNAATGQTLWRYPAAELFSFQLLDDQAVLLALRERKAETGDQWLTRLVWLDAATGQPTATSNLPNLADSDPQLGPLVPYKDRIFTFFGRGQHDPNRDLVELVPAGDADKPLPLAVLSDPWRQRVPSKLAAAAFQVLPDWQLTSGGDGDRTGLVADIHGEKDALGVRSTGAAPIILAREITLPAMGRPRLRLRMANDGGQVWKLEVRHGEQLLKTEEIKDETYKDRWKTIEIDLAPVAGRAGWPHPAEPTATTSRGWLSQSRSPERQVSVAEFPRIRAVPTCHLNSKSGDFGYHPP